MVSYLFCGKSKWRLAKTDRNSYLFIFGRTKSELYITKFGRGGFLKRTI